MKYSDLATEYIKDVNVDTSHSKREKWLIAEFADWLDKHVDQQGGQAFIVMGTTGEYSDRYEWAVMAYLDESAAQEHVVNADRRAKEIFATRNNYHSVKRGANEFDPEMSMDYTGTDYFIYTVPLERAIRKLKGL